MSEHRIEERQEYQSCTTPWYAHSDTRIRVVGTPVGTRVEVATLGWDDRELRRRKIETSQLHASRFTDKGKPRKGGYYLVRRADGTPAGGGE